MVRTIVLRVLLAASLWYVMAEGRGDFWGLGVVAVAASVWVSLALFPPSSLRFSLSGFIALAGFFIWESVRSAFQVSLFAFRGRRSLHPNLVLLKLDLPPGGARILLVNAVSLMPGTLGVHLDDDSLHLHVLDERLPIEHDVRQLEGRIAWLFGVST